VFPVRDWRSWTHAATRAVPGVIGAGMLVRKSVIESVGGFDEQFFMYSEETDWQYRIRQAGWLIWFVHDAEVTHLGGASGGTESLSSRTRTAFFESLDYFERKNFGVLGSISVRGAMLIGSLLRLGAWSCAGLIFRTKRTTAGAKIQHYMWLLRYILTRNVLASKQS
jgi:GT2 family glycosyltransferase